MSYLEPGTAVLVSDPSVSIMVTMKTAEHFYKNTFVVVFMFSSVCVVFVCLC